MTAASATPLSKIDHITPGKTIIVRDEEWLVTLVEQTADGVHVHARGQSELVRDTTAAFYSALDRIEVLDPAQAEVVADESSRYRRSKLWLESLLRKTPIPYGDSSLAVSHGMLVDRLNYQDIAVRKFLNADNLRPRILLADTVGLGKTLEIGMMLSELVRRGRGERILIVTPRHVLEQTQHEMWCRFGLPFVRLDSEGIQQVRQVLPATRNPFTYYKWAIISLDTLKQPRYSQALRKQRWDAVVIDECHNVTNSSTQNNELAEVLAPNTEALILASATPHNGKKESFGRLLRLLDVTSVTPPNHYDSQSVEHLIISRHRNSPEVEQEVGHMWAQREEPQIIGAAPSPAEEAIAEVLATEWLHPDPAQPTTSVDRLFPWTLAKAFLSSPAAFEETILARRGNLASKLLNPKPAASRTAPTPLATSGTTLSRPAPTEQPTKQSTEHSDDTTGMSAEDTLAYVQKVRTEHAGLEKLLELNKQSMREESGKFLQLVNYLKSIGVKNRSDTRAVVFAERVATLQWLQEKLPKALGIRPEAVAIMHGGMSDTEQMALIEQFKLGTSKLRVLVTGDVASEGVNLHARCHHLIHYDIPWSLIRIEQRNGRIDRYGQEHNPQITYLLLDPQNKQFAGDIRILQRVLQKEHEAHQELGDAGSIIGEYTVGREEEAIRDVLAGKQQLDDVFHSTEEILASDSPEAILAKLGLAPDGSGAVTAAGGDGSASDDDGDVSDGGMFGFTAPHPTPTPSTDVEDGIWSLYESDYQFLLEALYESFHNVPQNSPEAGGVGLKVDEHYSFASIVPPLDLKQRLLRLPQEYLRESNILEEFKFATTKEEGKRQLKDARDGKGINNSTWPVTHYLGPLHPVLEWAEDRALAKLGRNKVFAIKGNVNEPTVLVMGTISNKRGQTMSRAFYLVKFMDFGGFVSPTITPLPDLAFLLTETGFAPDSPHRGPVEDAASYQPLIPQALSATEAQMAALFAAQRGEAQQRLDAWIRRIDRWLGKQQEVAVSRRFNGMSAVERAQKEKAWAALQMPDKTDVHPLLVVVPGPAHGGEVM